MSNNIAIVDRTSLKFNQASIITFLAIAFLFGLQWLVGVVALILLIGTAFPSAGAFKLLYTNFFKRFRILHADPVEENVTQHLFAQGLGGVFLVAAFLFLTSSNTLLIGWALSFIVAALALVNLTTDFCLGCVLYLRLRRISFFTRTFIERVTNN